MGSLLRNTDVLAGGGAALLLLLLVFPLQVSLPLSVALAVAAYVGLRLALPKPAPKVDPLVALAATVARCEEQVTIIQQFAGWAGFAGKPEVRARLTAIHQMAKRILGAISSDPNKHQVAQSYLDEYLLPITSVLSDYVRLSNRDLELARDELATIETRTLPLIERRLNSLYEQIHSADLAKLELATKMLEYTLQPLSVETGPPIMLPEEPEPPARRRTVAEDSEGQRAEMQERTG